MKSSKSSCDFLSDLPAGNCILLSCPPLIESRLMGLQFIQCGIRKNTPAIIISLNDSPEMIKEKGENFGFNFDDFEKKGLVKWVDGYSYKAKLKTKDSNSIKRINGPIALTDISIFLSNASTSFKKKSSKYYSLFDSISVLTLYNSNDTIFRFLEVITAKIKTSKGVGIFMIVDEMHDAKFVSTIRQMMDGMISFDKNMNLNVVSFPTPLSKKSFKLSLGKAGFEIID